MKAQRSVPLSIDWKKRTHCGNRQKQNKAIASAVGLFSREATSNSRLTGRTERTQ
jgi:hypothetical protein